MTTHKKSQKGTPGKGSQSKQARAEELDAFARHLAEVLRIARTHPGFTSRLYDDLADAWNEYLGRDSDLREILESEETIRLALSLRRGGERGAR